MKKILVFIVLIFVGTLIITSIPSQGMDWKDSRYTQHGIIRINNDAEFATQATAEGWNGDGTSSNPYIIEGYDIDAQGAGGAIYIGNTTVHFIVRNCHLYNASFVRAPYFYGAGVQINSVKNGIVEGNNLSSNSRGITLYHSSGVLIEDNGIYDNQYYGIHVYYSSAKMYNNTFTNNSIVLEGGEDVFTTQDISTNNTVNGKPIYYYKNADMHNISVPSDAGEVILGNVTNMKIENLEISHGSVGLQIGYSTSIIIMNNTCSYNSLYGMYLYSSSYNLIENNTCDYNSWGIYVKFNSNHNRIVNGNKLLHTHNSGVSLQTSSYNLVENNTFKYTSNDGIYAFYQVTHSVFSNNTLWNNPRGITVRGSSDIVIDNNEIDRSTNFGVSISSSSRIRISNNSISYGYYGIRFYKFSDMNQNNVIENNTISHNFDGIHLQVSNNTIVKQNLIEFSSRYGLYLESDVSNTTIYNNSFYYNNGSTDSFNPSHMQAYDSGMDNYWNIAGLGNYWHDWANNNDTNDQDHNGIVDWPYIIDGPSHAKDYYPLTNNYIPEFSVLIFIPLLLLVMALMRRRH